MRICRAASIRTTAGAAGARRRIQVIEMIFSFHFSGNKLYNYPSGTHQANKQYRYNIFEHLLCFMN